MANNVPCKVCGYKEAEHEGALQMQFESKVELERQHSNLVKCSGYIPIRKYGYQRTKKQNWVFP